MRLTHSPFSDVRYFTLLLAVLLTSCAPMTVEFYRPDAPGGKVVRAYCPPVESVTLINIDGVIVSASASMTVDNQVSVTIGFEVPEGNVVSLDNPNVASMAGDIEFSRGYLSGRIWKSRGHTSGFQVDAPMPGKREKRFLWPGTLYGQTDHAYYWFSAVLSVPDLEAFVIKLPKISVNDIKAQLPLVRFTRDKRSFIGSLNC